MQTKDHWLLGKHIIKYTNNISFSKKREKWAFLIGCVEPDCNILTYLKATVSKKTLAGHNFDSVREYLQYSFERLGRKTKWSTWDYFVFGRTLHYVIDMFTYPHNNHFYGTIAEHCKYERSLHKIFPDYVFQNIKCYMKRIKTDKQLVFHQIERIHEVYEKLHGNELVDCKYSLYAVCCVMNVTSVGSLCYYL